MPFGSSQWMYASGGFYNNVATQSLRFDDGSSAYLTRTPSSAGNRKTWTWSGWAKLGNPAVAYTLFSAGADGSNRTEIDWRSDSRLQIFTNTSGVLVGSIVWNPNKYRDPSAWYHLVFISDTTNATNTDRFRLYVNGSRVTGISGTSGENTFPSQNADTHINNTVAHSVGRLQHAANSYFDGYLTEVNFIDGQALDPSYFGEFKNGVWIAKKYTGSYGTNGFRLQFNQTGTGTASSSTIGADTSGNANHFSSSGIVASDCDMPDSPENNFCTWNPLSNTGVTLANGNLETSGGAFDVCGGTIAVTSGKWYWECTLKSTVDLYNPVVYAFVSANTITHGINYEQGVYFYTDNGSNKIIGHVENNSTTQNITVPSAMLPIAVDDVMQFAYDGDTGKIWFGINNVWADNSGGTTGNPSTGANPTFTLADTSIFMTPLRDHGGVAWTGHANFGQLDYDYTAPTDFNPLSTANLPEPTISPNAGTNKQSDDYFNTVLYTGDGNNTRSITGVGFQADWVWLKRRSSAQNHRVFDIVRGSTKGLYPNLTDEEASGQDVNGVLSSFDSDGFSTVNGSSGVNAVNQNNETYVAWNWKAGGTAVSNTDGTITSSVSANTDAGFSIVTYNGNATASTIGHGLNKIPQMVIVKERGGARPWVVYHANNTTAPETDYLRLNETNATADFDMWNDTAPTSSVFSVSSYDWVNNNASPFVAYCFAEISGYSSINSYIGNGSADGTFVYTGFRPAWVMVKRVDVSGADWFIYDAERVTFNVMDKYLASNTSSAEATFTTMDFISNGFKFRTGDSALNASGGTFIYMAFSENPFKYANAR